MNVIEELTGKLLAKATILGMAKDDKLYSFAIESALYYIYDFINYDSESDKLPPSLHHLVLNMTNELIADSDVISGEKEVASIKSGDSTVAFVARTAQLTAMVNSPSFARRYENQLYRYRKLQGW